MRRIAALLLVCAACAHGGQKPQPAARDAASERQRLFELPAGILHAEARESMAAGDWAAASADGSTGAGCLTLPVTLSDVS